MSKLKRNLFLLVVALLTARAVYAAVVPIVDTKASSSYGATYSTSSSTGNDHTSTYSGVECGEKTASSPEGCNTLLGIGNAVATPCDGGKYTCSLPARKAPARANDDDCSSIDSTQYPNQAPISDCSDEDNCITVMGPAAEIIFCEETFYYRCDYNRQCTSLGESIKDENDWCKHSPTSGIKYYRDCFEASKCMDLESGIFSTRRDTQEKCEASLLEGLKSSRECISDDSTKMEYLCEYKNCSEFQGSATIENNASAISGYTTKEGKIAGQCWNSDTNKEAYIIKCKDDYSNNQNDNTSCTENKTPKICTYEGTPKYHKTQCECNKEKYPYTSDNCDKNLAGDSCKVTGEATRYQYCLPDCGSSENKHFVAQDSECKNSDGTIIPQDNPVLCVADGQINIQCACPTSYKTEAECAEQGGTEGIVCSFDGVTKYEKCKRVPECPPESDNTIVQDEKQCSNSQEAQECSITNETTGEKAQRFQCLCSSKTTKTLIEFCENKAGITPLSTSSKVQRITQCQENNTCNQCLTDYKGSGTSCDYEAKENNQTLPYFIKYEDLLRSCEKAIEELGEITIVEDEHQCSVGGEQTPFDRCTYSAESKTRYICSCPTEYKTIDNLCQQKSGEISLEECKKNYTGNAPVCTYDTVNKKQEKKYLSLGYLCPDNVELSPNAEGCQIQGTGFAGAPQVCTDSEGQIKYSCSCPPTFGTECTNAGEIRGGIACKFSNASEPSYEKCLPKCDENIGKLAVDDENGCPYIDGIEAEPSGQCFKSQGTPTVSYQCGCPKGQGYQTLEDFCGENGVEYAGRTFSKEECLNNFVGQGSVCTYDGNRKYKKFVLVCPKDRPLYYTQENCTENGISGSVDYVCQDRDEPALEKIVCKCPSNWLLPSGQKADDNTAVCDANQEASGKICDFEGYKNLKYEKCYPICDKLPTNGQGIHYLEEDKAYEYDCRNLLGDGATFGANNDGGKCSKNHVLFSPCYCGKDYSETCANDENKRPAENVSTCTINGTTYYNSCQFNACLEENSTIAIVELGEGETAENKCKSQYGSGATGRSCGTNQAECTCDTRTYTETCDYPYTKPSDASFCKYGEGSTLMKNGTEHYKLGECKVRPLLALCGKHILKSDGTPDTTPTIYVTETEAQCKGRYGNGAQTQLCEYEGNTNKRAFNCYFQPSEFPYTEDNCPVRHVLSKEFVTINGTPHYKSCDCHSAYKYHKYNCAGMLSGGACTQKVTSEMLSNDATLREAHVSVGTDIAQYPYCQCTTDYNQTCDGERYIGVGTPCNGKYTACECKKDNLPENWVDNYYGCPGGKKPTGVTKSDGCGGKYYQCSVTDCTWQHTETCKAPLVGVDGCQDNQGNIGGYKSCRCPDGYKTCQNGMAGKGDPCILNGEYYYTECEDKTTCIHGETQTCQQEFLIGVNPCTRNDVTYFEYCKCSAGFDKLCENGEVGVGLACKLNGKEYYQSCTKPVTECTPEHKAQCDVMQEKYDPCVNSDHQLMYKCKCPSNWTTCEGDMGATDADTCVDSSGTRYFSQCPISETCTPMQEKTYKVCTDAQKGTGNSCVASDGAMKYAECEDTTACRSNGYQFTCLGFDATALGTDFCVDGNGNKLYKECKCPTNWITCSGKNNTKGRSCTALNEKGVSQEPVYESCSCDSSLYKYTCEAEEGAGNVGVIPSKVNSCTPATYNDGRREEGTTLYQACSCQPSYKYNCKGNGHIIDENQNYCEQIIGGTKLYEYCACDDNFSLTCADPGQVPPTKNSAICTPANPDAVYNEKGVKTLYSECGCSNEYRDTCDGEGQYGNGDGCTNTEGVTGYKECLCNETYQYTCAVSGENKGIRPFGSSCKQTKSGQTKAELYTSCTCDDAYRYRCYFESDKDSLQVVNQNQNKDYCETTDSDGTRSRLYKECTCPKVYNKLCGGASIPENANYCINEKNEVLYAECNCVSEKPAGYEELLINGIHIKQDQFEANRSEFASQITTSCGYADNYEVVADNCSYVYWKCANTEVVTLNLVEHSKAETSCKSQDSKWIVDSAKTKTYSVTPKEFNVSGTTRQYDLVVCRCPAQYAKASCADDLKANSGKCKNRKDKKDAGNVPCDTHDAYALTLQGDSCTAPNGTTYYEFCECNIEMYTYNPGRQGKSSCFYPGGDDSENSSVRACKIDGSHVKEVCPSCSFCEGGYWVSI